MKLTLNTFLNHKWKLLFCSRTEHLISTPPLLTHHNSPFFPFSIQLHICIIHVHVYTHMYSMQFNEGFTLHDQQFSGVALNRVWKWNHVYTHIPIWLHILYVYVHDTVLVLNVYTYCMGWVYFLNDVHCSFMYFIVCHFVYIRT